MYLRKEGDDNCIYVLGRNGEPRAKAEIRVMAHNWRSVSESFTLITNKEGRINLGPCKSITKIEASGLNTNSIKPNSWNLTSVNGD